MAKFLKYAPAVVLIFTVLVLMCFRWFEVQSDKYYSLKGDESLTPDKLSHSILDGVEKMVLFIGYPRSGHTLVASLLDAHPHCIISNEYNVIQRWSEWEKKKDKYSLFQELFNSSYWEVISGYRAAVNPRGFFGYHVPDQWQGTFDKQLKVIGDKHGGVTTKLLLLMKMYPVLEELQSTIDLPFKFLHVVRNPFDNIATMVLRKLLLRKTITTAENKVDAEETLRGTTNWYFKLVDMNFQLHTLLGVKNILDIRSEDMINHPREILTRICLFLDVRCSANFLEDCARVVHKSTSHTRDHIKWPADVIEDILQRIQKYPFLSGYTFTS